MRRFRSVLGCGVLLLVALSISACNRGSHPSGIDKPAPQFTLTGADGQTVSLAQFHGHIVLLNFWATWCAPCIDELPSLMELQRRFPRMVVIAISQDADPSAYRQFLLDYHIDFLTLRDPSARIQYLYGTVKIPETYVIDRNGILRRKFVSAQDWTSPAILNYFNKLQPLP